MLRFVHRKSDVAVESIGIITELGNLFAAIPIHLITVNKNLVKWVGSDGGGEYVGREFRNWLHKKGIVPQVTTIYSPESKGASERLNRTLLNMGRSMMVGLPHAVEYMWSEAANTACFLQNRLVSDNRNEKKTSYEALHGRRPDLCHTRTFGSKAYAFTPKSKQMIKFDKRAIERVLVGYSKEDAYKILLKDMQQLVESKDVTF